MADGGTFPHQIAPRALPVGAVDSLGRNRTEVGSIAFRAGRAREVAAATGLRDRNEVRARQATEHRHAGGLLDDSFLAFMDARFAPKAAR